MRYVGFGVVRAVWVTLGVAGTGGAGCTDPDANPPGSSKSNHAAPAEALSAQAAKAGPKASLHSHMQEHFVRVDRMQKAVVAGELELAYAQARWLAEHQPHTDLPAGWEPYIEMMQNGARKVIEAETLADAAVATARVAGACGSCHIANRANVKLGYEPSPNGADAEEELLHHQWAANRLWDAVVSRSDELWKLGAHALEHSRVVPASLSGTPSPDSDLARAVTRFDGLTTQIQRAQTPNERVEALGAYLGSCVGCHQVTSRGPDAW
jgi:hypothetical protein